MSMYQKTMMMVVNYCKTSSLTARPHQNMSGMISSDVPVPMEIDAFHDARQGKGKGRKGKGKGKGTQGKAKGAIHQIEGGKTNQMLAEVLLWR